jgi:ubiquinone/menaquinone biosynthesis C-methylase UbiE
MEVTRLRRKADFYLPAAALLLVVVLLVFSRVAHRPDSEVEHLVQVLSLKPDSLVADVGAGSGEMSIAIAARVPHGVVYATEINPRLLDKIRTNARRARMNNVTPVLGKEHDTELPPNCCDAIFLREVYHHLTDPIGMDRSLYRALRPSGRLAVIDFEPAPGTRPPAGVPANRGGHGVPKHIVVQELTQAGFELVETMDWPISRVTRHYCMLFRKQASMLGPRPNLTTSATRVLSCDLRRYCDAVAFAGTLP